MKNDAIQLGYYNWITRQEWSFFATLTFRKETSETEAARAFTRWIASFNQRVSNPNWVRVTEAGSASQRIHLHVLLGKIPRTSGTLQQLERSWARVGGIAHVSKFDPARRDKVISYMLKTISEETTDKIDVMFHSEEGKSEGADQRRQIIERKRSSRISGPQPRDVVSHDLGKTGSRNPIEQSLCPISPGRSGAVAASATGSRTLETLRIAIPPNGRLHVERHGEHLVIILPLHDPRPSKTGITNVIGSTGGPRATFAEINGYPIVVHAVAMINLNRPIWKQRGYAVLARWDGKLHGSD